MDLSTMTAEDLAQDVLTHLVDSARGIYAGQSLIQMYGHNIKGLDDQDREILEAGPDHEWYYETLDDLCGCTITQQTGEDHSIHFIDGGIYAVDDAKIQEWEDATGQNFWDRMT